MLREPGNLGSVDRESRETQFAWLAPRRLVNPGIAAGPCMSRVPSNTALGPVADRWTRLRASAHPKGLAYEEDACADHAEGRVDD